MTYVYDPLGFDYKRIEKIDAYLETQYCGGDINRQFGDQSGNIIIGWLEAIDFSKKFTFEKAAALPLAEYKELVEYNKRNTYAVGASFDAMFCAFVMMASGRQSFGAAYALGGAMYEHIFLAGYTPKKKGILDLILTLKVPGVKNDLLVLREYFKDEVLSLGIDLTKNNFGLTDDLLAQQYLICCALQKIRSAKMRGVEPSEWTIEVAQGYESYADMVTVVRAMSKGKTDLFIHPYEKICLRDTDPSSFARIDNSVIGAFLRRNLDTYAQLIQHTQKSLSIKAQEESGAWG